MSDRIAVMREGRFEQIGTPNEIYYKPRTSYVASFVGDANINALAFLPLKDKKKIYGLMIVGSDEENFFEKGISYYEGCIVDFNANIKSTKLYLQMEDMARKDGLTGIYNRVYNTELFKKVSKEAVLKNKTLSVALFDIDKFKLSPSTTIFIG